MKDETIQKLLSLWEPLERARNNVPLPNFWKQRKPRKRELHRQSIRTWGYPPDWYGMMNITWAIGGWMHYLEETGEFPDTSENIRLDALLAALRLGRYLDFLHNPEARDFIERMQELARAVAAAVDEGDSPLNRP